MSFTYTLWSRSRLENDRVYLYLQHSLASTACHNRPHTAYYIPTTLHTVAHSRTWSCTLIVTLVSWPLSKSTRRLIEVIMVETRMIRATCIWGTLPSCTLQKLKWSRRLMTDNYPVTGDWLPTLGILETTDQCSSGNGGQVTETLTPGHPRSHSWHSWLYVSMQ